MALGCSECGSVESVVMYTYPDGLEVSYCPECAANQGFCLACGEFFGGTEEFRFTGIRGFCMDCLRSEFDLP